MPTPSKRLSTLGEVAADISKHRHAEPASLRKLLRGDLDWIVMKALEKDRSRRYETAHGLARDIERHLSDEPVHARPPSAAYRLKKYVRKHRVLVGAVAVVLIALTIGYARTEYQRRIAIAERDRAEGNLRLADDLMRDVVVPAAKRMEHLPFAQEHLHEITSQIRDFYERMRQRSPDDPELRRALAWINYEIGRLNWVSRVGEPASHRSVLALQELVNEFPNNVDYEFALAQSVAWLSLWYTIDLRFAEALAEQRRRMPFSSSSCRNFPRMSCIATASRRATPSWRTVGGRGSVGRSGAVLPGRHSSRRSRILGLPSVPRSGGITPTS